MRLVGSFSLLTRLGLHRRDLSTSLLNNGSPMGPASGHILSFGDILDLNQYFARRNFEGGDYIPRPWLEIATELHTKGTYNASQAHKRQEI